MWPEDDPDADLLVDWRAGTAYAVALRMPSQREQQSILPFKQKKASTSRDVHSKRVARTLNATTANLVSVKNETACIASVTAVTMPVVYELSDSDGTPIRRPAASKAGQTVALAKFSTVVKLEANSGRLRDEAEVVDLGSDSDEDDVKCKFSGPVDQLRAPIPQEGILERSISIGDKGKGAIREFPGKVEILRKPTLQGGIPGRSMSLGDGEMRGSIFRTHTSVAVREVGAACGPDLHPRRDESSSGAVASTELTSRVEANEPRRTEQTSVIACHSCLPNSVCGFCKSPNVAAEPPTQLDPAEGVIRECLRDIDDLVPEEKNRKNSPGQVEDLTSDDGGQDSEPEWLRDHDPTGRRGSWNNGSSVSARIVSVAEEGLDFNLPGLGENNAVGDGGARKKKTLLCIPGLESADRHLTTASSGFENRECTERLLAEDKSKRKLIKNIRAATDDANNLENIVPNSQKSSKVRKVLVSDEEQVARDAEKQRGRELKKAHQEEEKKERERKKAELKKQKEASKAEATEKRRLEKESNKWRKGKFALQNTTVYIDTTVIEMKNLGSLLLRQLEVKNYERKVLSNPIEGTIVWKMKQPAANSQTDTEGLSETDDLMTSQLSNSQLTFEEVELKYVVIVLEGEEFASLVAKKILHAHVSRVQKQEQHHYKSGDTSWTRPNVEQALAEFITHYAGVHSRLCIDEAEIADHVVGLMRSLAECPFKQKLTSISIHANGDHVTKSDPNREIIRKSTWLKFLVAIPHVTGAIAIAIANEYSTMRALLNVYLDPSRTVHDKEFLLEGLMKEPVPGAVRAGGRRVGPIVSKRIYRVLMAKDGTLSTDDAEGADHFTD